eukprot:359155-Chlamydomonas_euryale.AAC.7
MHPRRSSQECVSGSHGGNGSTRMCTSDHFQQHARHQRQSTRPHGTGSRSCATLGRVAFSGDAASPRSGALAEAVSSRCPVMHPLVWIHTWNKLCLNERGWWDWVAWSRSTWRDRALAALRPVLTSRLAGWGWYGVAQDCTQWRALCDSALPADLSPLPCCAQHRHTLRGSTPCNFGSDSGFSPSHSLTLSHKLHLLALSNRPIAVRDKSIRHWMRMLLGRAVSGRTPAATCARRVQTNFKASPAIQ